MLEMELLAGVQENNKCGEVMLVGLKDFIKRMGGAAMNKKLRIGMTGIVAFIAIVVIPLFLNEVIFNNNYYSKISNDGWAAFLGSYLGGLLGGAATLGTLYFTIKDSNQKMRKQINSNDRPYIKVLCFENTEQREHFDYVFSFMKDNCDIKNLLSVNLMIGLHNIGKGPAIDIKAIECSYYDKNEQIEMNLRGNIAISAGEKTRGILSLCIEFDEYYLELLKDNAFGIDGAKVNDNSLNFKIQYYDINKNKYIQNMIGRLVFLTDYSGKIVSCTLSDFIYYTIQEIPAILD